MISTNSVPGYRFASWETGYGDFRCEPDWSTLRVASWLERSAIVLCDVLDEASGEPVEVAPRRVLARQLERVREAGFLLKGASELEFFVFRESFESARAKAHEQLDTFGSYVEDYHVLQGTKVEPLVGAIRRHLDASGIEVEFSKGEWGPGQHEINLRYCEVLEMADRHVLYKNLAKEIAHEQELAVTFMAKWHEEHAGNSMHVHLSLWDPSGRQSRMPGDDATLAGTSVGASNTFLSFLGGMLEHARAITLFLAPNVNSYKRFMPGTFAPTGIAWSYDNRTCGFRVVGRGESLRVECRIPGADATSTSTFAKKSGALSASSIPFAPHP